MVQSLTIAVVVGLLLIANDLLLKSFAISPNTSIFAALFINYLRPFVGVFGQKKEDDKNYITRRFRS
jgi:hypothetical protein